MDIHSIPVDAITEAHLQSLVGNEVYAERLRIEYKEEGIGRAGDEKREFLYDVSSFANTAGGLLVLGMKEESGLATELVGFDLSNPDEEIARLDQIMHASLKPRLRGARASAVRLESGRFAIVIKVPLSWVKPHMVDIGGTQRFYARRSAGKLQMDVGEIRDAFLDNEQGVNRAREFRIDRVAAIGALQVPMPILPGPKLVFHLVPLSNIATRESLDLTELARGGGRTSLAPIGHTSFKLSRRNFDGLATWREAHVAFHEDDGSLRVISAPNKAGAYLQIFRWGAIESVDLELLNNAQIDPNQVIASATLENSAITMLSRAVQISQTLGSEPPFAISLTLLGVVGMRLAPPQIRPLPDTIDRDDLFIDEVVLDSFESDYARVLRPIFDSIWQASGLAGSPNYTEDGS